MKKIDEAVVKHVAKLARLDLTEREAKKFEKDLSEIITAFKILDDAPNAEPSFQPIAMRNILRDDSIEKGLSQEEALHNTKHKEKGFFRGPKAV
jgi:aspartyl-tRNA(Asn)/glutamyl-tRNA(Gln) amidotransferase subunit C